MPKDLTKYNFNGVEGLGKARLVHAVVKQYIADESPSYASLKSTFPDSLQGSNIGVVITVDEKYARQQRNNDTRKRYYDGVDDALATSDGMTVCTSTEWGIENIGRFLEKAGELGYGVQEYVNNEKELIIELTDGAIRNGYIRIPSNQDLFEEEYFANNEHDEIHETFTLIDAKGKEITTYILRNKGIFHNRFTAYFKNNHIHTGASVTLRRIEKGRYTMEFDNQIKSIKVLYDEYKKSPDHEWIELYKERCSQVTSYSGRNATEYDDKFLRGLWKEMSNGITNARPGTLSNDEYENLKGELPEITSKIYKSPTPTTLNEVMEWANTARSEGKFKSIKRGVIHRVFSAISPQDYSTILGIGSVERLIKKLNSVYSLGISTEGNWAELNIALLKAIKSQGLEREDVYLINTFVWNLFKLYVQGEDNDGSDKTEEVAIEEGDLEISCKNIIYYGPPGTGKTYHLQKQLQEHYTDTDNVLDEMIWLRGQIEKLSWHEIIVLVLLQADTPMKVSDIISHKYYTTKAEINERGGHLRATAWSALQNHSVPDSVTVKASHRREPAIFDKTQDSLWYIVDTQKDQLEEYVRLLEFLIEGPKNTNPIKRYDFVTFHQSYGYEEFIEGLRPITSDEGDISYEVKSGIFKRICKLAESDPDNPYAIVIDEINRGNISKIFGELITLVEKDKRAGAKNELTLTLPYSGSEFSVPSNLDVIGTMNTADRSLTHIDVALRRRFDFKELRTDYTLVSSNVSGIDVQKLLYAINQRIELLLDREHIIGHAILMDIKTISDLEHAFNTSIIPLLEEYFFENWEKISRVLNHNGFVKEQKGAYATWLGEDDEYASKSYRINYDALNNIESYIKIYSDIPPDAFTELSA